MVQDLLRCPRCKVQLAFDPTSMRCPACKAVYPIVKKALSIYDLYVDENSTEKGRDPSKFWDKDTFEQTYQMTGYHEASTGFDKQFGYAPEFSTFLFQRVKGRMLKWVAPGPGHRVLDIGCGAGYFLCLIREQYLKAGYEPELAGIDISEAQLSYTAQRMKKEGVPMTVVHGNGEYLPFADDSFDLITCSEVLEHVRNPRRALSEMYRILKPGGLLLLSTPSMTAEELWEKIVRPVAFVVKKINGYQPQPKTQAYDVPWYANEFRQAIRGANLQIIDFEHSSVLPHLWYSRFVPKPLVKPVVSVFVFADRFFKPVLKPLAQHFVVRAGKAERRTVRTSNSSHARAC